MKWILLFATWSAAQGQAPTTAEFNNKGACEAAVRTLNSPPRGSRIDLMFAFCVEKGE